MTPKFCRTCGLTLVPGASFCGGCGTSTATVAAAPAPSDETALHVALERLVTERGEGILADPEQFRAALDDYLAESAASPGEIYLLTDAVRLGALESLRGMVAAGAPPASAVESAGERLARDRGSADPTTGVWAVAALGHAVGAVPASVVEQYDARTAPPPAPATDPAPAAVPAAPPPPAAPAAWTLPGSPSPAPSPPPLPPPPAAAPLPVSPPTAPPPPRRTITPAVLVGVLAILVMLGVGAGTAYLLTRGDDDPSGSASDTDRGRDDQPTGPSTPPPSTPASPTATITVTEGGSTSTTTVADPETTLRDAVAADQARAEELVGSWVPQLASISGEINGSWSSALAEYEELLGFYPDAILVDADAWPHSFVPSETFDTVFVVLNPEPATPYSAPALDWCQLNRGDRAASCYAKLLETSGSPRDNTDQNDPEPEYN